MKVLHIGNLKSGIDTYVRNTVAMADDKFEFIIVSGADDNSKPYMRNGKAVRNYKICMYRALNPFKDLKAVVQTVRIIQKEKPDVVHCHSAKGGVIGRFAAFITGTKVFYTPHAFSFLSAESRKKRAIFLALEKIARLNSTMLACSESERLLGIRKVGYKEENAKVWCNSIPAISESDIKTPENLNPKEKFIISIGRPSYQKNPLLMVETMRLVHKRHPDIKFYLVGVGFYSPMMDEMKALADKYELSDVIKLVPWLSHEETLGYLRQAMVYMTTSLYEGLPIAVLEAMAMRKAIVSSDVIGNNDCVKDGFNGYLLQNEANMFAEKVCTLIENETLRKEMGNNSLTYFNERFNIKNRIEALEQIYLDGLNKKKQKKI